MAAKKDAAATSRKKSAAGAAASKPAARTVKKPAVRKTKAAAEKEPKTEKITAEAAENTGAEAAVTAEQKTEEYTTPRRSVAFIGSECYPFVKTGGLGDVMYALPKTLVKQNCDVKVILPRYKCIPWEYQQKMIYRGAFEMDLCADGRSFYVGVMEYVWDGVVYDFIDNEEFFSWGNP